MEQTLFSHITAWVQQTTPTSHFRCRYQRNLPLVRVKTVNPVGATAAEVAADLPWSRLSMHTHYAQLLGIIGLWGKHESTSVNLVRLWCKAPGQVLSISSCHQKCAAIPMQSSFCQVHDCFKVSITQEEKHWCSLIAQLALAKQESSPHVSAHST